MSLIYKLSIVETNNKIQQYTLLREHGLTKYPIVLYFSHDTRW